MLTLSLRLPPRLRPLLFGVASTALFIASGCTPSPDVQAPRDSSPGEPASSSTPAMPQSGATSPAADRRVEFPFLRVLGTAQDGGLPHVACQGPHCRLARADPAHQRLVSSLAVVVAPDEIYLLDATPDLPEQIDLLRDLRTTTPEGVDRAPLSGVFLTHAHLGHYTGLSFLGFEAVHTQDLPVYVTPRFADFLAHNGPWSQLVDLGNVQLEPTPPGQRVELGHGVSIEGFTVPHRDEFSDTVAFLIRGPRTTVLFVPDTDRWSTWSRPLEDVLKEVDIALVDGTFFSNAELPGRSIEDIPHPLITTTMDLLEGKLGRTRVYFTHFNHSNPAVQADTEASRSISERGFYRLEDGAQFPL